MGTSTRNIATLFEAAFSWGTSHEPMPDQAIQRIQRMSVDEIRECFFKPDDIDAIAFGVASGTPIYVA